MHERIDLIDHEGKRTPRSDHTINHILLKGFLSLKISVLKNSAIFLELESIHWYEYLIRESLKFLFLPIIATLSLQNELVISYVIFGCIMAE